jgi:di/tricarboxylate transporter
VWSTGVAKQLGDDLISGFEWMGSVGPLAAIYLTTVILTALLSNGASISIVFPIAKSIAKSTGECPSCGCTRAL